MDERIPTLDRFDMGSPALVCRWRLAGGMLPLANRHLRALSARFIKGKKVSPELVGWAKQHVEQRLKAGSTKYPDGVLMLIVDETGRAAMTVGPYTPLENTTLANLISRVESSYHEAEATGVSPESMWLVKDDALIWGIDRDFDASGTASLIEHLAHTIGLRVERHSGLYRQMQQGLTAYEEAFMVSDEHGVVPASDRGGKRSMRFAGSYEHLLNQARNGRLRIH